MTRTVLIIAFVAALAASAAGQTPSKPFHLYLQGGASLPQEDLNELYKYGYHGGVGLGFSILPRTELIGRASYHKYDVESINRVLPNQEALVVSGGDMTMIMYGAEIKLNIGMMMANPYGIAGYGWAQFDTEDVFISLFDVDEIVEFPSHTENYWVLGCGMEFTRTFIEGRYYTFLEDAFEETTSRLITVSFGLKL